jgi:Ser-tRNA(Ala) deacylase AlaX
VITAAQRDPYARRGRSTVLRVEPAAEGRCVAVLDDSVLYAEGGGQPWDLGTVGGVPVVAVRKAQDGVAHELAGAAPVGEVDVELDWARRFDHMQQHTGQHLLSALAADRFGWETTSFHLHPGLDAVCDVELSAPTIGPDDLDRLQELVNAAIREARPVQVQLHDALPAGVRTRGLAEGFAGPIRLVVIDGIDLNTCGGTHVRSLAELQAVVLLGTERVRGGTRVSFVVGERVVRRLLAQERRVAEIGGLVSRGVAEVVDGVRAALEDGKAATRGRKALSDELADLLGAQLAAGQGVRALHRDDADGAFLNRVASVALRQAPDAVLWLTGGAGDGAFLLAGPPATVDPLKARVLEVLGTRGGGPAGRLQGRGAQEVHRDAVLKVLGG